MAQQVAQQGSYQQEIIQALPGKVKRKVANAQQAGKGLIWLSLSTFRTSVKI